MKKVSSGLSFTSIISSLLILLVVVAVPADNQKIETVDGVRFVHNKKGGEWGNHPRISIELIRTIGDVNTADENLAFDNPLNMAVDDAGNIYILDSGNQRVQKFSPEGKYVATFGRKGQGPGDLSRPGCIDLDKRGYVYVLDGDIKKIQVFSPDGKDHQVIPTTRLNLDRIRLLASGPIVATSYASVGISGQPKEKTQPKLVKLLDADLNIIREFGEPFDYGDEMTNSFANTVGFEVDSQDNIFLIFAFQNRIEKYSQDGQLLWKADRELNYSTKVIERGKQEVTKTSSSYTAPKLNRVSGGIAVDEKGRAWIVTFNRQIKKEEEVGVVVRGSVGGVTTRKIQGNTDLQTTDMYKLEIYAPDGVLLGEIPLTQFADAIYIWKDKLFLLDRARGVKYYEYQIIEH
jgi:sugar lactone lactonase YvrE